MHRKRYSFPTELPIGRAEVILFQFNDSVHAVGGHNAHLKLISVCIVGADGTRQSARAI
jgi:hypothetical protein